MRREVLFAILLGIILGGAVAFGIWRANLAFGPQKDSIATVASPEPNTIVNTQLVVTQPENNTVVSEDNIIVKGATTPGSTVVIMSEKEEKIVTVPQSGTFEEEIKLAPGPNEITISSFDEQSNESRQTLVVIYSTEFPGEN